MPQTDTLTIERPQHEYDDMAFAIMCVDRGLPRQLRHAAGLSQDELAARVGANRVSILAWERDDVRPSLQDLDKLARYGRELRRLAHETGLVGA